MPSSAVRNSSRAREDQPRMASLGKQVFENSMNAPTSQNQNRLQAIKANNQKMLMSGTDYKDFQKVTTTMKNSPRGFIEND